MTPRNVSYDWGRSRPTISTRWRQANTDAIAEREALAWSGRWSPTAQVGQADCIFLTATATTPTTNNSKSKRFMVPKRSHGEVVPCSGSVGEGDR
mgnify:CR=1 FL=1|jgi:hypothetical protein